MNVNKKIFGAILSFLLLVPLSISLAQNANSSDPCARPWSPQTGGVSHKECPNGMHYPTFNAYNDAEYLKQGQPEKEYTFAWVREFKENINEYNSLSNKGYQKEYTLTNNEDIAETYFYMHNSGDPTCNTPNNNNSCGKSTIAKDVKLKITGLQKRNGKFVSDGVISGNQRIHTITATISGSNITPRSITDKITIKTNKDKSLELDIDNLFLACQPNSKKSTTCDNVSEIILTSSDENQLFGNGLTVNSTFAGSNINQGFFASEGYRMQLNLYFFTGDTPQSPVCQAIQLSPAPGNNSKSTSQTFRATFTPNERTFHTNLRVSGATNTTSFQDNFLTSDYTEIKLSGLTSNSRITVSSLGSPNCQTTLTFPEIPGDVCTDLTLVRDATKGTETDQFFTVSTTPSKFLVDSEASLSGNGTFTKLSSNEYKVSGFNQNTVFKVGVPNTPACQDQFKFSDIPGGKCELIKINFPKYNYKENPRPEFSITPNPSTFTDCYIWEVKDQNGNIIETKRECNTKTFRPDNPLDGNQTVYVRAETDNTCSAKSESEYPPKQNVCEDIQVIRTINNQIGKTIPSNGKPAVFHLNTGQYEGKITLEATGQPEKTVFLTKDQKATGKITIDPDETFIVLNTGKTNTIRIYAQEQNQYTEDCYTELKANSNDPGDPLTELEKTVDKSFATDGDILTYTIRYTISPLFNNPQFKEILEEFNTAIIKDNVDEIYGIQDTLNNPLESLNSRIIPTDVFLPAGLEDASGDLFGPEGLIIPNLDEKAGNTYTIKYTAILKADIIEECKIISNSCGFEFPNTAEDNFGNEDTASVLATCPFVVSRSFGNVFLEEGFENTIDISQCTNTKSSEGPVFTPRPQQPKELIKSGGTGIFSRPTHRICQESIKDNPSSSILGDELDGYQNPLENFSSSVCEVALFTGNNWTSDDIERSMRSNASRYTNNTNLNSTTTLNNLNQDSLTGFDALNPNPKSKVYRKTNGNLIIGEGSDLTINDGIAKTIIVEGHDLIINNNITYGANQNPLFPSQIAFIVIGGDIQVGPEVTDLSGIITAIPDENDNGGIIKRSQTTNKLLTLTGSMFGDSGPLFAGTSNPGNLSEDKGAVTVIYDGNIILNTPPVLEDIVKFSQYQTVR